MTTARDLEPVWWTLRLTYGLVPVIAGIDKFTNLLVDWTQYLSPFAVRSLPIPAASFMQIVGVIEIVAGVLVLGRFARFGAYLVSAWLIGIALNLVATGHHYDVAVRDVVMAIGAFSLARLTELRARDHAARARSQPAAPAARQPSTVAAT
jgi:uncharacterized membrane protein YphA (DoxX/SURF4 family)